MNDVEKLVHEQLQYFETEAQCQAFSSFRVPVTQVTQTWEYGSESHVCFILAKNETQQIVYCGSGFGPSFPWGLQKVGDKSLGTDGQWHAYLYETFVSSAMWRGSRPTNFVLRGPGERTKHNK